MKISPWWFGLGGLLLVLMFIGGRASTEAGHATATPARNSRPPAAVQGRSNQAHASSARLASRHGSIAATIARNGNLLDGLTKARRIFGPGDPDLLSAVVEAMMICAVEPALSAGAAKDTRIGGKPGWEDPRKLWAIDRLHAWCEGFDGRAFYNQLDTTERRSISKAMEFGSGSELQAAREVVGTSVDSFHLATAGNVLISQGQLPLRDIFQGVPPLGSRDLLGGWIFAASLSTCARQLGCGPDSPLTVAYCAQAGCRHGMNYEQALADSLPPREYRSVVAFRNWIARQHGR
jgi:hypothetical protein